MPDTFTHNGTTHASTTDAEAEAEALERARIDRALSRNRASLTYLRGQAEDHDSRAIRMRQLAAELTNHVQPLRTCFTDLRRLHTPHTWEGRAATASRLRLDGHEARTNTAVRSLDYLIDDLEDQARWHVGESADLGVQISHVRYAISALENQRS